MIFLLLSSKAQMESLMKVLSVTHVTKDITMVQFDSAVANIPTRNFLGFSDNEIPSKGRNYNKVLHISLICVDTLLSRVLVDMGSSLNVIPKNTLMKLSLEGVVMKPNFLIVKAFDGSRRVVIGEVNLPINIRPTTFAITYQVMDIHPTYSCLLGRLWIYAVGEVKYALHQKLKFMTSGKMIVIGGEEDILVSHLSSF